jgi:hypothetical protein
MKLADRLKAARERQGADYFNGFIHAYCDNQECTGREIRGRIKTYWADDPTAVFCPLCGKPAIPDIFVPNAIETLSEFMERTAREARQSVNVERYVRRTGDLCVPLLVAFDDSLPK